MVRLAAAVEARLPADQSFTRLVSPVVLAQRLRNDLWVFAQLARAADEALGALHESDLAGADERFRARTGVANHDGTDHGEGGEYNVEETTAA